MPKSNWALSDAPAQRLNAAEAKGPFSSNWGTLNSVQWSVHLLSPSPAKKGASLPTKRGSPPMHEGPGGLVSSADSNYPELAASVFAEFAT